MEIKRKIISIIALLISLIFLISSPTLAYASVIGDNTGGGNGSMNNTSDYRFWSRYYAGYRFYIIDNDLSRVSGVYDFTFSNVCDISDAYGNTRFDTSSTPSGNPTLLSIADLARISGSSVESIPLPTTSDHGQGAEFREWFLAGAGGSGTNIRTILSNNSTSVKNSVINGIGGSGSSGTSGSNQETEYPEIVKVNITRGSAVKSSSIDYYKSKIADDNKLKCLSFLNSANTIYQVSWKTSLVGYPDMTNAERDKYCLGSVYNICREKFNSYESTYISIMVDKFKGDIADSFDKITEDNKKSENNYTNILSQNIPLATQESILGAPAVVLLTNVDVLMVSGYDSAWEALLTGDYYLIVEPLVWLYVPSNGKNYPSKGNRTYGSYYNIATKWVAQGGIDTGGFYTTYMTKLGNNCMVLNSDFTTTNDRTVKGASVSQRNISVSLNEMNSLYGLSMHLYSSNDIASEITVIKNYIDADGKVIKNTVSAGTETININDEDEYEVVQWQTSINEAPEEIGDKAVWSDIISSSSKTQSGSSTGTVNLSKDEIVVYIQLQSKKEDEPIGEYDWTLTESYITNNFSTLDTPRLSDLDFDWSLGGLSGGCGGHEVPDGYDEEGEPKTKTVYCSWSLDDKSLTLNIKNSTEAATKGLAFSSSFNTKVLKEVNKTRSSTSPETITAENFEYRFTGYRADDKLSLADYISSNDKTITQLGFNSLNKKSTITRKKNGEYVIEIPFKFIDNSTDLITTSKGDEGCYDSDEAVFTSDGSRLGKLLVQVYRGQERNLPAESKELQLRWSKFGLNGFNTVTGKMVSTGASIKFNPYIRMQYKSLNKENDNVKVLGEYERTILPNDYAEIAWNKKDSNNLQITSNQWTTHRGALDWYRGTFGSMPNNNIIPGGAIYNLRITENNTQKMMLNTYQTIVEGKAREISTISNNLLTEELAIANHVSFVDEAIETLEGTKLIQYVSTNLTDDNAWDNGIEVSPGCNISKLKNGSSTSSTDGKYYLRDDNNNYGNTARNDLDIYENSTKKTYHRVYSDTEGNVYYVQRNSLDSVINSKGKVLLTKNQNINSLSDNKVKMLNDRTQFLTKFLAAIERNTGNDNKASWASSDGKWYNEAYEGIIVLEQCTEIKVGFYGNVDRSTVLDPKLIPQQTSKNGAWSGFMMQYKTGLTEDIAISTFKGKSVFMKDADLLFWSQPVYIINRTVQDLS